MGQLRWNDCAKPFASESKAHLAEGLLEEGLRNLMVESTCTEIVWSALKEPANSVEPPHQTGTRCMGF